MALREKTRFRDPEQYLLLEGRAHGKYAYADTVVAMHRLGIESRLKTLNDAFDLKLCTTACEKSGHRYIGDIQWKQAHILCSVLEVEMLTLPQFWDMRATLKKGIEGQDAYYGDEKRISDQRILRAWYYEVFGKRDPWRSEWLDAHFVTKKGVLCVEYEHRLAEEGTLQPQYAQRLLKYFDYDGMIDVSSVNAQGLATRESSIEEVYGYLPRAGNVARFFADSDGAVLVCDRDPSVSNSSLGVRASVERERAPWL